jgi:hypothetical protein
MSPPEVTSFVAILNTVTSAAGSILSPEVACCSGQWEGGGEQFCLMFSVYGIPQKCEPILDI